MEVKYLIIGAGPTGLGAGHRLQELGEESFLLLEKADHAGGLSSSYVDDNGFTWDVGGHVVFSHYEYFDKLVEDALGGQYLEHQRISQVRTCDTWVPYPFQNNIRHLPENKIWQCVQGLLPEARPTTKPENFGQWIDTVFGAGIGEIFMHPYNYKVWATKPENMDYRWIGERVSVIDLEKVLKNIILKQDDVAWGPNNTFRFPQKGGTGAIFESIAKGLGEHIRYNSEVVTIDPHRKTLTTKDGTVISYQFLLNTGPVDKLVTEQLTAAPHSIGIDQLKNAASTLTHNGVHISGVGLNSSETEGIREDPTCWMYFPENNSPFYRVTNFHNYSPQNVAKPGKQIGFMCETSFSKEKQEDIPTILEQTIQGLINSSLMTENDKNLIATKWQMTVDYGYPVPCLQRDTALQTILPELQKAQIYSRGRFGGWKYEVSNMDHSVMQGVEWAELMHNGTLETTYTL
ncbi:MAG: protoporphyrinogen/coproporphyrinogen oxidase [Desulfovibrio sp.]